MTLQYKMLTELRRKFPVSGLFSALELFIISPYGLSRFRWSVERPQFFWTVEGASGKALVTSRATLTQPSLGTTQLCLFTLVGCTKSAGFWIILTFPSQETQIRVQKNRLDPSIISGRAHKYYIIYYHRQIKLRKIMKDNLDAFLLLCVINCL